MSERKSDRCVLINFKLSFEVAQLVHRVAFWFDCFCVYTGNLVKYLRQPGLYARTNLSRYPVFQFGDSEGDCIARGTASPV